MVWNSDTQYALGLHRTFARFLGIWSIGHPKYLALFQVAFNSILPFIMMAIYIENLITNGNCSKISDLVDILCLITISILSIMKVIFLYISHKSMYVIVNSAMKDWNNVDSKKSRKIMFKYANIGRLVFIIQMCGAYAIIIPLIIGNPPSRGAVAHKPNVNITLPFRNIPIGPNCWISPSLSENWYLVYYCFVTMNLIIVATAYVGGDVYIFGIAMHVCGQFELLYNNLENLNARENDSVIRKNIRQLTQRHCHLLMLANKFENSFNLTILVQVIASGFLVSVSGILLIWGLHVRDYEIICTSIVRINLLYIQLYMYSYIGDRLSTNAEILQVAVYNCTWYEMSPSSVRDLIFIMMRNNYLFHLTAGKIYKMNIFSFQKIVKSMLSLFSVLRLMFKE